MSGFDDDAFDHEPVVEGGPAVCDLPGNKFILSHMRLETIGSKSMLCKSLLQSQSTT